MITKSTSCLSKNWLFVAILWAVSGQPIASAYAGVAEDIGHTRLKFWLADAVPTGRDVAVVMIEASNSREPGAVTYSPNAGDAGLEGKSIIDASKQSTGPSGHATAVAKIFFGNDQSLAPGIQNVESYVVADWYLDAFLSPLRTNGSRRAQPRASAARVGNHSFVAALGPAESELLRRLDWLIATDEFVHVVGFNGTSNPIASSAFNVIVVDNTAAVRATGSAAVDSVYTRGRTRPDLVVPETNPSKATPWVAAAAALLIEAGHSDPSLSTDPEHRSTENRVGQKIFNAERAEVIKAALMAGATRRTENSANGNIVGYRQRASDRSANGLDRRYGAGQLDIYRSHQIIVGGEQNSREDQTAGRGKILSTGFDYDPAFGGNANSNAQATYFFSTDNQPARLAASLVWNIAIDGGTEKFFIGRASLHNLDLSLFDVSAPEKWREVAASYSFGENSENLWLELEADTEYAIRVTGVGQFEHDYALAWRIEPLAAESDKIN